MLKKVRIAAAALFFVGITLLFVGLGHQWWGWMAKLQFLPSCMALNFGGIAFIVLLTLVFGRIYCSVICPMGVFQDIVIRLRQLVSRKGHKPKRHFVKEARAVRYGVLAIVIISALTFSQLLLTLLAPYSAYGRVVRSIAGLASGEESVAPALLITGGVTLVVICVCAWIWGRGWCNTICPVGSVLGLLSRFSLFKITIDRSKCVSCRKCERGCKSSCIDIDTHSIDHSRCVDCFDCLGSCPKSGIGFRFSLPGRKRQAEEPAVDKGRRAFMSTAALIGGSLALGAQNKRLDGGLADVVEKTTPERTERLVPFGARGVKDFYDRCTACQLCVSNCPNGVLRASTDIEHFLQPQMGYEKGWCRPECTTCSQVCPAGAILPLDRGEKLSHKIGTAKVNLSLCLAAKDEAGCGNCSRHCPTGAVRMIASDGYRRRIPVVAEAQCIGCGACEYLCPARPISAITVDGISIHSRNNS